MFGRSVTRTRSPTLKREALLSVFLVVSMVLFSFIARLHLCDLFKQLGQRNMFFVDEHTSRRPNPASVVRHAEIERITEIIVGPAAPFTRVPYAPPGEHLACHVSVEFPLLFFLLLVMDGGIGLAANIVRRVHIGAV